MGKIYTDEARFRAETDAKTIQNAIDFAAECGSGIVVIPAENPRTGENLWVIEKAILLPDDITVILENAHLRLADGVQDNIFRNKSCWTDFGCTMEGEQKQIRILGVGNAVLDGGKPNGLSEQRHREEPEKYSHMNVNLLVLFHNVRDFEIRGLNVIESRYWALCFLFCRWGTVADINFKMYGTLENQDGIDLRVGCEFILLQNITGYTGDDTIALTALPADHPEFETKLAVEGKACDIHDITIRDVTASSHGCGVLRFLNEDGAQLYNVTVDNLKDTGMSKSGGTILFGTSNTLFCKKRPHTMGEFRNITVRNVSTNAQNGLKLAEPIQDLLIENYATFGQNILGMTIYSNFVADNVVIRNVSYRSDKETADAVFSVACPPEAAKELTISHVRIDTAKHLFRINELPLEDCKYNAITESILNPEKAILPSAYGRYHRYFFGKEIKNRPRDNRFDGTIVERR